MSASDFAHYRAIAQAFVTALRNGDRDEAFEIVADCDPLLLALTLGDLVAYVHHRWANATGIGGNDAWQELMLDVAEWEIST